jgi:replicative DNA helicase
VSSAGKSARRYATKERRCPVCDGDHACSVGDDGFIFCRRRSGPQPGFVYLKQAGRDDQWAQYRRDDDPAFANKQTPPKHHANGRAPSQDWKREARRLAAALTGARRAELAAVLGLPEAALAALPLVGFSPRGFHEGYLDKPCFTFPMCDAAGACTGISCRYPDGQKKTMPGGHGGLFLPRGLRETSGPVFCPEGPSDTLTLCALGLPAAGRPSNRGGVEHLANLFRSLPPERPAVVVGEYDPNPKGQWPGYEGAVRTARLLAGFLGRDVSWVLPPRGAKDVRQWANGLNLDVTCSDSWSEAGKRLHLWLDRERHVVEPGAAGPAETPQPAPQPASGFTWSPTAAGAFARADYRPQWLIDRVLVAGQPAIFGGPRKSLKTSLLLDLAVSLGSGTPFLGFFAVARRKRVAVLSGESGEFTVQETARRICAARKLDLADLDGFLSLQFRLPQLANAAHLAELARGLRGDGVEVAVVDPLYLSLLAGQGPGGARAENLYDMGPLLLGVARAGLDAGTTPVFAHHTRRAASGSHEPLDLDDLAYAGIAEFARQWLLLSRRAKYEPGSGAHKLWLNVGGSTGHGGLWGVDVEEGNLRDDFTGRTWAVQVHTFAEERQSAEAAVKEARRRKSQAQDDEDDEALLRALDLLGPGEDGCGLNQVQNAARLTEPRTQRSVQRLSAGRLVEEIPFVATLGNGGRRTVKGLRRRPG